MLEILALTLLFGLVISSLRPMRLANPFQIYFLIWFLVVGGYFWGGKYFIPVSFEFLFLILLVKLIALIVLMVVLFEQKNRPISIRVEEKFHPSYRLLFWAQILVFLVIPFVYQRANELAGGVSIFSVDGYIRLRSAMTEDGEGYGVWSYFFLLSYIIGSIRFYDFVKNGQGLKTAVASLVVSFFYVYMATGRTFVLLLMALMIFPLIVRGLIGARGMAISFLILLSMFFLIAALTAKGVAVDDGVAENVASLLENLRGYTVAPLLAFYKLFESDPPLMWGQNTFRAFIAVLSSLGFQEVKPIALIRGYQFVPDPTNVYTVYDIYFRDFLYVGVFLPPFFLFWHWLLYARAVRYGGRWSFYYAASIYPLVMQFFQDQYFTIFSMWVQIAFWYWIFLGPRRSLNFNGKDSLMNRKGLRD